MDEFLRKIADPLARLIDAAATYVERITPEDEDENEFLVGFRDRPLTVPHVDERGEVVLR